ncbi:MAG: cupin domain-containing protein [Paludibacter sp.]|nr:cupin domain-containing protein [Paludibacter sp.]
MDINNDKSEKAPDKLKGQVIKLANLIDYQEGTIVSRAIIDKQAGTLTLFAFDKDQGLSEHMAPFDALVYILDGEGDVTISGRTLTLRQGETVIMPANRPHSLRATSRFKMMLVMIKS